MPRLLGVHPHSSTSGRLGALVSPVPCDCDPADGGGALEFIIQACLPEGASLPDTALTPESWEWCLSPSVNQGELGGWEGLQSHLKGISLMRRPGWKVIYPWACGLPGLGVWRL